MTQARIARGRTWSARAPQPIPMLEIPGELERAQIGVVPTLRDEFTEHLLPVKLLEYLHMGLPAIAPRLPVIQRYFSDDEVRYFEPGSEADLAEAMKRRLAPSGPQLSPREGQVLRLLADGMSVAGIAKQLFVSESTAKTHISKLYEKLGAANRAQALVTAMRIGLLSTVQPGGR